MTRFQGRTYGVKPARRANPSGRSMPKWGARGYRIQVIDTINDDQVVQDIRGDGKEQEHFERFVARYDAPRYVVQIVDNETDDVTQDNQGHGGTVRKFSPRRPNPPMLAILNPLPAHLERFAKEQRLTADERKEFHQAIARYCEFHDVEADAITLQQVGQADGHGTRFLVGMGETEDVSYSANGKAFQRSNKRGTPFRHEFPSKPVMATTPDGSMIVVLNKPGARKRFTVQDWIRG